jgi:hypothetical protein
VRIGLGQTDPSTVCGDNPCTFLDDFWSPSAACCQYNACYAQYGDAPSLIYYWSCPQSGSVGSQLASQAWPLLAVAAAGIALLFLAEKAGII